MWNSDSAAEVSASASAVWACYTDLASWPEWEGSIKRIRLDGPFASGSTGVLERVAGSGDRSEPVPFTLVGVTENETFTIETEVTRGNLLRSTCSVAASGAGVRITHRAELDGPDAEKLGAQMGRRLSESLKNGVDALAKLVSA